MAESHTFLVWWMYFWSRIPPVPVYETVTVEMVEAWIIECDANTLV